MADISKIKLVNTQYDLKDESARTSITELSESIASIASDLESVYDLSSYVSGDIVDTDTVTLIKEHKAHCKVKYNNMYYIVESDLADGITLISIDATGSSEPLHVIAILKQLEEEEYRFSHGAVNIATYTDGTLVVKLDSDDKFTLQNSNNASINIIGDSSSSINLTLPSESGTIALVGQAGDVTKEAVINALGYTPYDEANPAKYINNQVGVIKALGYTPYDASNPTGFITDYTVTEEDVTSALGYIPYNATNPNGFISGINKGDVTTALGYTPYNATNPNHYISGITKSDVETALGFTPYNATNPNNYVNVNTNSLNNYYTKKDVDGMVGARFQAEIVTILPTTDISPSTIYLILQPGATEVYDEYMYIQGAWKKIGTTSIDMSEYAKTSELHNVAITGAYSSLVGTPTIPDSTSDLYNDSGYITKDIDNLTYYTPSSQLSTVATSGSYNDLTSKPTVPTTVSQLTNDSGFITAAQLNNVNISTFVNNVPYAKLSDIQGLEDIDVEEIKKAIAAMEHIGTVTDVSGGTGLTGSGTTSVVINHSNAVASNQSWPSGTSTPENGGEFNVRDVKYDETGHITGYQDRTITLPTIPVYDDTAVRGLIQSETTARELTDSAVAALNDFNNATFNSFVFCVFGIEPYIDPDTMEIVPDRFYERSDIDTGIYMDNYKVDIHLKAWLKYHYDIESIDQLKNVTCYVYAMGDHGVHVNHMVTFWSQLTNPTIVEYPHLQQVGSFIDDGYGSVHRFTATQVGAILSSNQNGYVQASPDGSGTGFVTGWNEMDSRITNLESAVGDINSALDTILGEVI